MTPGPSPLITRRNGKKQACEPCRRRKVACDHGYPTCLRCRRRSSPEACYYTSTEGQDASPTPARGTSAREDPGNHALGPNDSLWSSPASRPPPALFGPSSFPAAYEETASNLSVPAVVAPPSPSDSSAPPSQADIATMVDMDRGASHLAVRVLQAIPEGPLAARGDAWVATIGERVLTSIWETFGPRLRDRGDVARLREMGSMVCINTRRRLAEDEDDPRAWMDSFSGRNLRWEAVGLVFVCAAGSASRDEVHEHLGYVSSCITLASMGGSLGSIMLLLLYKRAELHACVHGETSLPFWKSHAEAVAMLTFSGHGDRQGDAAVGKTAGMQMRRRVACQVFVMDKFLSSFLGRAPLLTRRFCALPLPLDLDDTALTTEGWRFQRQMDELDAQGWNTHGGFYAGSLLRVRLMLALVRDEMLEAVLGSGEHHTVDDIMTLKEKEWQVYNSLPAHVICSHSELQDIRSVAYPKLLARLDHLLNMFLAERLLVKKGLARTDLLKTSFEILLLSLHIWSQKQTWTHVHGEYQWIIMGYATMAGAVLCMELIDPSATSFDTCDHVVAGEVYSRSSVVQQLSLLASHLGTSDSPRPDGSVASNVRGVIRKVLDHILNPRSPALEDMGFSMDWDFDLFAHVSPMGGGGWFLDNQSMGASGTQ